MKYANKTDLLYFNSIMLSDDCDQYVDTSGLKCPLPILRAKKALATMASGQILKVMSTDPNSVIDFTIFLKKR